MFQYGTGEGKILFDESVSSHNIAKIMGDEHSFNWGHNKEDNSVNVYFDTQYDDIDPFDLLENLLPHIKACFFDLRHEGGAVSRLVVKDGRVVEEDGEIVYKDELETINRIKNALCEMLQDIAISCGDLCMATSAAEHGLNDDDLEYLGL